MKTYLLFYGAVLLALSSASFAQESQVKNGNEASSTVQKASDGEEALAPRSETGGSNTGGTNRSCGYLAALGRRAVGTLEIYSGRAKVMIRISRIDDANGLYKAGLEQALSQEMALVDPEDPATQTVLYKALLRGLQLVEKLEDPSLRPALGSEEKMRILNKYYRFLIQEIVKIERTFFDERFRCTVACRGSDHHGDCKHFHQKEFENRNIRYAKTQLNWLTGEELLVVSKRVGVAPLILAGAYLRIAELFLSSVIEDLSAPEEVWAGAFDGIVRSLEEERDSLALHNAGNHLERAGDHKDAIEKLYKTVERTNKLVVPFE